MLLSRSPSLETCDKSPAYPFQTNLRRSFASASIQMQAIPCSSCQSNLLLARPNRSTQIRSFLPFHSGLFSAALVRAIPIRSFPAVPIKHLDMLPCLPRYAMHIRTCPFPSRPAGPAVLLPANPLNSRPSRSIPFLPFQVRSCHFQYIPMLASPILPLVSDHIYAEPIQAGPGDSSLVLPVFSKASPAFLVFSAPLLPFLSTHLRSAKVPLLATPSPAYRFLPLFTSYLKHT